MAQRPRAGETRDEGKRKAQRRIPLRNRMQGALAIPESIIKEAAGRGMKLHWVAETVRNEPNQNMVQSRLMNDWVPVAASKYPELVPPLLPGQQPEQIIRRGGQILCELPIEFWNEDLQERRKESADALRQVNWGDQGGIAPELRVDEKSSVHIEQVVTKGDPQFQD